MLSHTDDVPYCFICAVNGGTTGGATQLQGRMPTIYTIIILVPSAPQNTTMSWPSLFCLLACTPAFRDLYMCTHAPNHLCVH